MHTSVDPPGAQGTIKVTGFAGKSAAVTETAKAPQIIMAASNETPLLMFFPMILLLSLMRVVKVRFPCCFIWRTDVFKQADCMVIHKENQEKKRMQNFT
jgi:hypothetical protein